MPSRLLPPSLLAIALALLFAPPASAGPASTAALQVALRAKGLYSGHVDGIAGPGTQAGSAACSVAVTSAWTGSSARAHCMRSGAAGARVSAAA